MAATPFDSLLTGGLFATGDVQRLFSDSAEVRAMMLVEGALAKVQGAAGIIPELSATAIHRASLELQIDPGGLAQATRQNGVAVPALVSAFRSLMQAPEHAQYLHWGATSQDIQDSALMLRIRQVLGAYEGQLRETLQALSALAASYADTSMAARTWGQAATPTSFGAVVASWGWPLLESLRALPSLREQVLWVSLSGAAGTASELGHTAPALRADLAQALGLIDPGRSWHSDRSPIVRLAGWITQTTAGLGKMGEDLMLATQSGQGEVQIPGAGGSSTMPQKQNPVAAAALVALHRHAAGLHGTLLGAATPRQQRDGAAWFTEWLCLPQLCLSLAAAFEHARALTTHLAVDDAQMLRGITDQRGLIHAEALSFALTARMPRPEAQAAVKQMCRDAVASGQSLQMLALAQWPDLAADLFDPAAQMGQAPQDARNFVLAVQALSRRHP